ncbi:unnamed protein product [Brassica rapa subsp. narinosa]
MRVPRHWGGVEGRRRDDSDNQWLLPERFASSSSLKNDEINYRFASSIFFIYFNDEINYRIKGSHTDPGAIHASFLKLGFKTDQLLSKQLRLYGSCGSVEDAKRLFYDSYNSKLAGVAVWNFMIAINGDGNEAITMFENMPRGLSKTHATYWNTMLGCSHIGETGYAHYLLGRAFKCFGIEPIMELLGTYIDGLARHCEGKKEVTTLKGMRYKPNQEMVVSILSKYDLNADPSTFAQDFVQYLEEQQVSFYIMNLRLKQELFGSRT